MSCEQNQQAILALKAKQQENCDAIDALEAQVGSIVVPAPANAIPLASQDGCPGLRQGNLGTSTDYAREDHRHPITRLTPPAAPSLAFSGPITATSELWYGAPWTDEESVKWRVRVNILLAAGTGWGIVTVPVIAGYQTPDISDINTYRYQGIVNDDDTPNNGAMPDRTYMGQEAAHYLHTRRIYFNQFRNREQASRYWLSFKVKYICN